MHTGTQAHAHPTCIPLKPARRHSLTRSQAVHGPRFGTKNAAAIARRALDGFHANKKERGVDETLVRLYEPILWRALRVANPTVRANAAALLADAFPLQNPDAPAREREKCVASVGWWIKVTVFCWHAKLSHT